MDLSRLSPSLTYSNSNSAIETWTDGLRWTSFKHKTIYKNIFASPWNKLSVQLGFVFPSLSMRGQLTVTPHTENEYSSVNNPHDYPVINPRASGFCFWGFLRSLLRSTRDVFIVLITAPWILSLSWCQRRWRDWRAWACRGRGAIQREWTKITRRLNNGDTLRYLSRLIIRWLELCTSSAFPQPA